MGDFSYDEAFFDEAVSRWAEAAQLLADNGIAADAVPAIPMVWARNSSLNDASAVVNDMARVVRVNLLHGGSYVLEEIANTVRHIANDYLGVEEANVEISRGVPEEPGRQGSSFGPTPV